MVQNSAHSSQLYLTSLVRNQRYEVNLKFIYAGILVIHSCVKEERGRERKQREKNQKMGEITHLCGYFSNFNFMHGLFMTSLSYLYPKIKNLFHFKVFCQFLFPIFYCVESLDGLGPVVITYIEEKANMWRPKIKREIIPKTITSYELTTSLSHWFLLLAPQSSPSASAHRHRRLRKLVFHLPNTCWEFIHFFFCSLTTFISTISLPLI